MPADPHENDLQAYVDGQLDPSETTRIEAWLTERPAERDRIESYRRHKDLLRAALEAPELAQPGPPRLASLEAQLGARLARRGRRSSPMMAAAAAVVFTLGAGSHAMFQLYQEWRVPPVVEAATKAHEVFGNDTMRPVELSAASRVEMSNWFAQHLGAEIDIPDLRGLGLRFVGGRLLASPDGPMAQLLYQDRAASRLSVYLSAGETGGEDVHVVKIANYSAGYWQEGDFTYTIVADMEEEDLREIAFEMAGLTGFPRY